MAHHQVQRLVSGQAQFVIAVDLLFWPLYGSLKQGRCDWYLQHTEGYIKLADQLDEPLESASLCSLYFRLQRLEYLLHVLSCFQQTRFLVAYIPDISVYLGMPFYHFMEADLKPGEVNLANALIARYVADSVNLSVIDLRGIYERRALVRCGSDGLLMEPSGLLANDRLHLSKAGYLCMTLKILNWMEKESADFEKLAALFDTVTLKQNLSP